MGQGIRGTNPIACGVASKPTLDVERLKGEALRVYLQYKLRELDEQIALLSPPGEFQESERVKAPHSVAAEEDWEQLLDLGYLYASRDAIISALDIL
jgi:hypothetical protein